MSGALRPQYLPGALVAGLVLSISKRSTVNLRFRSLVDHGENQRLWIYAW